jgi:hypothetical protein
MTLDPWQFRLGLQTQEGGLSLGGFCLQTGPGAQAVHLEDSTGRAVGILF